MRQLTENELREVKTLTENSVEFTLIEPTENGLNKEVYRTNSIDMGNMYRNGIYRDGFNCCGAVNMKSAVFNSLLGIIFR